MRNLYLKSFHSNLIYEILGRAFCIFLTTLGRVVDSQGSTIETSQIEASTMSHFVIYSNRFGENWKNRGRVKITPLL